MPENIRQFICRNSNTYHLSKKKNSNSGHFSHQFELENHIRILKILRLYVVRVVQRHFDIAEYEKKAT